MKYSEPNLRDLVVDFLFRIIRGTVESNGSSQLENAKFASLQKLPKIPLTHLDQNLPEELSLVSPHLQHFIFNSPLNSPTY